MIQTALQKKLIIEKLESILKRDIRVDLMFVLGSLPKNNSNILSDIDIWVVTSNESALNALSNIKELSLLFSKIEEIKGIYQTTASHYFITFESGIQIDLNIISSATYHNIKRTSKYKPRIDTKLIANKIFKYKPNKYKPIIENLLLIGYTTLARGASKYMKRNYFIAIKFLDTVRYDAILPLIQYFNEEAHPSSVSLDFESLPRGLKKIFIETYARPNKKDVATAIVSCKKLLDKYSAKLKMKKFDNISDTISQYIN